MDPGSAEVQVYQQHRMGRHHGHADRQVHARQGLAVSRTGAHNSERRPVNFSQPPKNLRPEDAIRVRLRVPWETRNNAVILQYPVSYLHRTGFLVSDLHWPASLISPPALALDSGLCSLRSLFSFARFPQRFADLIHDTAPQCSAVQRTSV